MTPPFPPRHAGQIRAGALLAKASRSLLEVWGEEMFRNSGTVVELLGHRLMVFSEPQAIAQILEGQAEVFDTKPAALRKCLAPLMGEGLFIAEGATWRARRPATGGCAPLMARIGAAISDWDRLWSGRPEGETVELIGAMEQCAAELLCRALFGTAGDRRAATGIARLAAAYRDRISGTGLITMLALPEPMARLRMRGDAARIHAAVKPLVERARGTPGSMVVQLAKAPGLSPAELQQEVISLFAMGHDALATLLSTAWFLLAEAPHVEAALHAELATTLGGRAPEAADLPSLPMTRALLMEALRLYPPVPLLIRVARRDTQVAGMPVAAGTLACIAPWVMHRHQAHWEAPDEFRPERFLPGAPPPAPFTYLPFGLGPRVCVGQDMTMQMAVLLLATLAQRFRLHALSGHRPRPSAGLTLRLAGALPMRLERR